MSDEEERELQVALSELHTESLKLKKANSKLEAKFKERAIVNNDKLIEDLRASDKDS